MDSDRQTPPLGLVIFPVTPFQQNASLLWCEATRRAAIVDPGGGADAILAEADRRGVSVERVLVTHGHVDHAAAVADLADRLGVPVEGPHRADDYWIAALPEHGRSYGMAYARSFVPTRWLEDGDRVTVGHLEFAVLHCPGHTPGHVVFHHAAARFALVGDVLFQGSIGRTDFPGGDHATLIRSIKEKLFPLGDDVTVLPGHGPATTIGRERLGNPFLA